ncbi:CAAX amino terminal protease [Senna tora]|uniref:CAAX amino terminal protease n=1 Tax=Senna tora TaxID=362788 RepID=A0A834W6G1_9FABA|nr:CAAX amino terminal protease [Senna tora]
MMWWVRCPPLISSPPPPKTTRFAGQFTKPLHSSLFPSNCHASSLHFTRSPAPTSFKSFCRGSQTTRHQNKLSQGFSVLQEDGPWERGNLWSTLAFYIFILHIPLSFGGLSVVAQITGDPHLHPQTQVLSLLLIQILELNGALLLLKYTAKPQFKFVNLFKNNRLEETRNWILASAVGFGFLVLMVLLTSLVASTLFGPKPVNNPIVKEILLSSDVSRVACVLVYCIVSPLLEEVVYRGFLLTSLSSTMEWGQAVAISSLIFSASHFSGDNFLQLFIIGCVLASSYCWTGNLKSPILIHSLYNALTLIITYFY